MITPAATRPTGDYFGFLIDDFGIWQHTDGTKPIRELGYSLDDAARGLILTILTGRGRESDVLFNYIDQSVKAEGVYGFAKPNREFFNCPASDDATAQIIWAMGVAIAHDFRISEAKAIVARVEKLRPEYTYIRGYAYALLGYQYFDPSMAAKCADIIARSFHGRSTDWPWPEDLLTYGNAILPYALTSHALRSGDPTHLELAHNTLVFLESHSRYHGVLAPIGNQGWHGPDNAAPPLYSQQPIDPAYSAWAWLADYLMHHDPASLESAQAWEQWFYGNNVTGQPIAVAAEQKCYDGIDGPHDINTNSGAESNICYLLTVWALANQKIF